MQLLIVSRPSNAVNVWPTSTVSMWTNQAWMLWSRPKLLLKPRITASVWAYLAWVSLIHPMLTLIVTRPPNAACPREGQTREFTSYSPYPKYAQYWKACLDRHHPAGRPFMLAPPMSTFYGKHPQQRNNKTILPSCLLQYDPHACSARSNTSWNVSPAIHGCTSQLPLPNSPPVTRFVAASKQAKGTT